MSTLPTSSLKVAGYTRSPVQISLLFRRPFISPFYLSSVLVTLNTNPGVPPVSGYFVRGTGPQDPPGGTAYIQVDQAHFDIVDRLLGPPFQPFYVQLGYDSNTFLICELTCMVMLLPSAAEAGLQPANTKLAEQLDSEPPPSAGDYDEDELEVPRAMVT